MPIIEIVTWKKSYSINIPLIDAQHMELISLTNKLYRSCIKGRNNTWEVFMEVLQGAVGYVGYHFSTEEKVMEKVNYPAYDAHKQEHNNFVKEVLNTVDDINKGINVNPMSFVKYLKDWILTHIAVSDTALGKHLVDLKKGGILYSIKLKVKTVDGRFVFG